MAYIESNIYVLGLNEMVAGLKAMSGDAKAELAALNFKVGGLVVREAKGFLSESLIPNTKSSGDLLGSIKASRALKGVVVTAGNNGTIPYANAQNWGWFYDRKEFIYKNIMPKQFMNKGANKVRDRISDMYIKDLIAIYDKYSGKAGTLEPLDYRRSQISQTIPRRSE
jgi:hypothetical protein